MDYTNEKIDKYLKGSSFSNGTAIKITNQKNYVVIRQWYLREIVTGKKVLHFGFVDHEEIIEYKIATNNWLHKIINETSVRCAGIDINCSGVQKVRELGFDDIFCTNIIQDELIEELKNEDWDIVLLGEVLEHVNNPVEFLKAIRDKLKINTKEILITVPNAFYYKNFLNTFQNIEFINTDHRYWFTPYTLSKLLYEAGYKPYEIKLISTFHVKNYMIRKLLSKFPLLNNDILIRATL